MALATDARADRARGEQSRAHYPDVEGFIERDGVRIFYEVYGSGEPTVLLLPTWTIVHSRIWKMQIPDLARHCRVITFDPRGNGRSDRPTEAEAYAERDFAADAVAVLDATQTQRAIVVGFSMGAQRGLLLAAEHSDRVEAAVFIGPTYHGGGTPLPERLVHAWDDELLTDEGWAKHNRHYWLRDYPGYLEFFFSKLFNEPHSTKPIEDSIGWGLETTGETLSLTYLTRSLAKDEQRELARRVRCPVLVIHGADDAISSMTRGTALAEHTGGQLVLLDGSGHAPHARDPVKVNLLLRDFVAGGPPAPNRRWSRSLVRPRRALYISSPIGLGHAQRDVSIAAELRQLQPDLEIDWLAQHPVTAVLAEHGERLHPRSAQLASESAHIAAESSEHDLNCFQAIRRMDEILVNNFMVFHDAVSDGEYDVVIGDEAWDIDYYWHENPELKRTGFVWMTDFVGWLPMPANGAREAFVTADYNAEMIEHVERFPRIRDRAIFVGTPDDIVPDTFGPGLPEIRDWTERHYDFSGYITGFDPTPLIEGRDELRRELGFEPDQRVVVVTVGGSGVGEALLRRVIASYPEARRRVNGLRMIVVAGPRIDPASLGADREIEVLAFVPSLYRHLAACDLAVVQGGLTTTMELAAARRPFLYFPLRNHFEQNRHVRHRLERYGAGRYMEYETSTPQVIAEAIAAEIDRPIDSSPVESDGAARAAALIAPLLRS
jgi:pimeloyl-ACP methyl ester carboxylesterase/predicted glycosyltransferase